MLAIDRALKRFQSNLKISPFASQDTRKPKGIILNPLQRKI
ncbi:hypothetical protein B4135_3566 [Caldibacillus debilis]|uniref:Uncharacterized protein n=1 Tax=Caldibacillus debilis TaxID=301148 RepID=A0A150LDH5_9BACI|nr:hypothetical protein B4135_3566 [Caldibacillus debilis]